MGGWLGLGWAGLSCVAGEAYELGLGGAGGSACLSGLAFALFGFLADCLSVMDGWMAGARGGRGGAGWVGWATLWLG